MKIALLGYGKMGKTIEKLSMHKGHEVVYKTSESLSEGLLDDADVAIEFSSPEAAVQNINRCFDAGIPVVSGTTGWLEHYPEILKKCESCNGSFIYASNFSIGVNLFFKLNEYLAQLMRPWKDYEVSISEIHHTEKKDAPSGTAISIAEGIIRNSEKEAWVLGETKDADIGISAERIENVKGTHHVMYRSEVDGLTIGHEAHSRNGFALGAILAAEWLQDKKGVYHMNDVLQL